LQKYLHIISFDIPYPANYGGVIDVFHTIRCLHREGIKVILHCFQYGNKKESPELETICEKVYYYKRNMSFWNQLSILPFNVKSRISDELKNNLLKDNHPILFEVLHTCFLLSNPELKNRKKIFRHSNIEHDYFRELATGEKNLIKKLYLKLEAFKLERFEKQITFADHILSVSEKDLDYFKKTYPATPSVYLPSFHEFDTVQSKAGKGNYILYHGNLSVSENYNSAIWLIKHVFSKLSFPVIIAGLNAPSHLVELISKFPHISLKQNCNSDDMQMLIENAHIHCLYTYQDTGLKLKLLNVLFSGRFVLANKLMLTGTSLSDSCYVANTPNEYLQHVERIFLKEFTASDIEFRKKALVFMENDTKTTKLLTLIKTIKVNY
jgi:hypothetical protein